MLHNFKNDKPECKYTGALGTALSVSLCGSICGMRVCLLVEPRPGEETDNVHSAGTIAACPTQRARLTVGGLEDPLGQQRPLSSLCFLPSLHLFTDGPSVALAPDEAAKLKNYNSHKNRTEETLQKITPTCGLFSALFTLSTKFVTLK